MALNLFRDFGMRRGVGLNLRTDVGKCRAESKDGRGEVWG